MPETTADSMRVEHTLFIAGRGLCIAGRTKHVLCKGDPLRIYRNGEFLFATTVGNIAMVHYTQIPADWLEWYHIIVYGLGPDQISPGGEIRFAE